MLRGNRRSRQCPQGLGTPMFERLEPRLLLNAVPYMQDFSLGKPGGAEGWEYYSDNEGRIEVVTGRLRMDDMLGNDTFSQNEAILHVDLTGKTGVTLTLDHTSIYDEVHTLPTSFVGHYKGDGIALSVDGQNWVKVADLTVNFTNKSFALDPALQQAQIAAGSTNLSNVRIKFQQYDNYPASSDGREFDNIQITTVVAQAVPYMQDFSLGKPGSAKGWEYYSDNEGRIEVVGGRLRMDDTLGNETFSQNEAILHVNLTGKTGVTLTLDHTSIYDEVHTLPTSFVGHYKGDGIALSVDGLHWVKVTDLSVDFTNKSFALDTVLQQAKVAAGSSDISNVRIKFQQYDNYPASSDGREFDNIKIQTISAEPEMDVLGNSQIISDGDTTPSAVDHTDFGSVGVGGSLTRTFTIRNTGAGALNLTGVPTRVQWTCSTDFTVVQQPGSPVAAYGGTTTFQIRFTPSGTGLKTATVWIPNNDSNENPYNFMIQGTGLIAEPEMDVLGNSQIISDGDTTPSAVDHTDFGSVGVGGSLTRTFTIRNTGAGALNLTGVPTRVQWTCSTDFTVVQQPGSPVAAYGGTTTFQIRFTPSGTGLKTATVWIPNNDSNENPYNFAIQGTGLTSPGPQILLSEDFNDGNYNGWILVDQGTIDTPMAWSAATGVMVQSTNVHTLPLGTEIPKLGTYAYWQGGTGWTDYKTAVTIKSADDDAIGIMFRYQDENNYYRFSWDKQRNYRRLVKCVNGQFTLLAEDSVQYVTGQNYQVKIVAQGSTLQVSIGGSPVFSVNDSSLSSGTIALYSWGNVGSYFDNIVVESGVANQAPIISSVTATPSIISDAQTSQLQVNATDPDSGPAALTYSWSVQPGEGSLSDASIANPVYTPPDVSSTQTFTLTVKVFDGADTTTDTVDITVTDAGPQVLLSEDFNDGNYNGWALVEQGTIDGPMAWSAATGVMVQSSNVYSLPLGTEIPKLGTYAYWQGGTGWTDYKTAVTIKSADDDAIGIMFRYQDENNYYRFSWDKQRNYRRLVKCVNGQFTLLAEDSVQYVTGQNYQVKIVAQGSTLQVSIGGSPVFSVNDSSLSSGTIALYSWGNVGSYFDNIVVESGVANQAPIISSVTATPSIISDAQTSQLQVNATDPDSGPAALTYSWSVQPGEGSLSDASIANPVYTPPDVSSTQTFTLTVKVFDGADTTTDTVDITVTDAGPQVLLSEDFNDGNYNGWILVDQGTIDTPMAWSAATGVMVQSTNVHTLPLGTEIPKLGTYAYWQGGTGWTDYKTAVTIKSADDDAIGIMFRYQDENNYYRFSWDKQRNYRRLVKCVNGQFTLLAEDSVQYVTGQNYQVKIVAQGSTLQVSIGGSPVFSVNDSSLSSGTIALYSWGNVGSYFDNIVVENLSILSEDFNDGNYNGWALVEQGTIDGPMAWSAATGVMVQSSNVYSLPLGTEIPKLGTYAYWQGGTGWTDYKTAVTIKSADDDAIGIMFRYQDENNYYRFSWDKQRNYRRLVKCVNGQFTLLAQDSVPYVTGQNYQVKIGAYGSILQVSINGSPIFLVNDSSLSSGTIALYSWGNVGSYFDNIRVT